MTIRKITKKSPLKVIRRGVIGRGGGGVLGAIGNTVIHSIAHREKGRNLRTSMRNIPGIGVGINTLMEMGRTKSGRQLFSVIYNPGSDPIDLDNINRKHGTIKTTLLEREPRIIINSNDRFLLILMDNDRMPIKRILWMAEFINRGKAKSLIPYTTPLPQNKMLGANSFVFKLYRYPRTNPDYKPLNPYSSESDISIFGSNRNTIKNKIKTNQIKKSRQSDEYVNFIRYLDHNNLANPIMVKLLNVSVVRESGTSLFNAFQRSKTMPGMVGIKK